MSLTTNSGNGTEWDIGSSLCFWC